MHRKELASIIVGQLADFAGFRYNTPPGEFHVRFPDGTVDKFDDHEDFVNFLQGWGEVEAGVPAPDKAPNLWTLIDQFAAMETDHG